MSEAKLARRVGVSKEAVHWWKIGRAEPTAKHFARLCDVFDADPRVVSTQLGFVMPKPNGENGLVSDVREAWLMSFAMLIDEYGKSHTIRVWQKGNFNSQKYRQTN
jgi:transcriptional regulator with XRE-family HTH domain